MKRLLFLALAITAVALQGFCQDTENWYYETNTSGQEVPRKFLGIRANLDITAPGDATADGIGIEYSNREPDSRQAWYITLRLAGSSTSNRDCISTTRQWAATKTFYMTLKVPVCASSVYAYPYRWVCGLRHAPASFPYQPAPASISAYPESFTLKNPANR